MQNTAQQAARFSPLGGPAGSTLQGIISTGNAVDVSPITQAAQMQGQQAFSNLMPQVNEQFGALGLGSSSAREAELGRGAQNIATSIGAQGLQAGVGAQEAARARQLQGFNPLLQGSGQQLQGILGGGQLGLGAASEQNQFNLGRVSAAQNFSNPLLAAQNQQMNMAPQAPQGGSQIAPNYWGGGNRVGQRSWGGGQAGGVVPEMAAGGRVDYGDFLSKMLFGQEFARRPPEPQMPQSRGPATRVGDNTLGKLQEALLKEQLAQMRAPKPGGRTFDPAYEKWKIANTSSVGLGPQEGLERMRREQALQFIGAGGQGGGGTSLSFAGTERRPGMIDRNLEQAHGAEAASQAAKAQQQIAQFYINQGINPLTGQRAEGGGEIQGPSMPPDVVPIMAQGGELVVPLELRHEIEMSDSTDPIVLELKGLIEKPIEGTTYAGGGAAQDFLQQDMLRRTGQAGDPASAAITDRINEGRLIADMVPGALHPIALPLLAAAAGGYEGLKGLGAGKYLPGPLKADATTSPASMDNFVAILKGFTDKPQKKQEGGKVEKVMGEFKRGTLHSGSSTGPQVTSREQAIAIAMSEAGKSKKMAHGGQVPESPVGFAQGQRSFTNEDLGQEMTRGGFMAGSQTVDPMQELDDRFLKSQARVDLLSSLSMRAPSAARMKLSGMLQQATSERDSVDAQRQAITTAALQNAQQLMAQQMQNQAAMERVQTQQSEMTKRSAAQESARTEREGKAARAREEQEVFTAGGKGLAGSFDPARGLSALSEYQKFQGTLPGRFNPEMGPAMPRGIPPPVASPAAPMFDESELDAADTWEAQLAGGANVPAELLAEVLQQAEMLREQLGQEEFMRRYPGMDSLLSEGQ